MEQGSANKSPSTSSEQNKQPYFVGSNLNCELSQVVQPLPQGCPNVIETGDSNAQMAGLHPSNLGLSSSSQSKHADNMMPFSGELQAQSQDAEDLFGVYLKGISRSRDQHLSEENQVSKSDNVMMPHVHDLLIYDSSNNNSRYQGQWVGSSQIPVSYGNFLGDSAFVSALHPNWATYGSSAPLRIGINQAIPNPMNASSVFNQGSGNTNFGSTYLHYGSSSNQAGGSSYRAQGPTISGQKRKMTWEEDNITPNQRRWNLSMQGDQGKISHISASSSERFTLYDKRYAEMGLPLDPHLRIFNATKEKSTGGSK